MFEIPIDDLEKCSLKLLEDWLFLWKPAIKDGLKQQRVDSEFVVVPDPARQDDTTSFVVL